MLLLTLRDLQYRKLRFGLVSLLAGVVLTLVFLMTGLVEHFNREPFDAVEAIGAEAWLVADGVSGPFTSVSALPAVGVDDPVAGAGPVVVSRGSLFVDSDDSTEIVVIGHVLGAIGSPPLIEGRSVEGPTEVVLDESAGVDVGQLVRIGSFEVTVVGLTERATVLAGLPFAFLDLGTAQDLTYGNRDTVTAILLPAEGGASAFTERSSVQVAEDALGPLESAIGSIDLIRALLWVVAAIIVGAVVYLSALERTRDFAVLKAVGASNRELSLGLVAQAALVALVATAIAALLQRLITPVFPLPVQVPSRAYWQVPLLAVVVSVVSAIAGMRQVAASDPADAFAGAA